MTPVETPLLAAAGEPAPAFYAMLAVAFAFALVNAVYPRFLSWIVPNAAARRLRSTPDGGLPEPSRRALLLQRLAGVAGMALVAALVFGSGGGGTPPEWLWGVVAVPVGLGFALFNRRIAHHNAQRMRSLLGRETGRAETLYARTLYVVIGSFLAVAGVLELTGAW
ncbi:hypothetical protein ACFQU9_38670 [Actinomadura namibiensis]|uniref:DUF6199 domain-containing protein n=1 Tax=Actinomadura namibiensis TaxID=182080 RepID=A0A7W3QK82_ACTNM|nr:hypothetical protein [Actinomadura namibiensis]MBA8950127.1 hypothetical protein [Actinomadura namibiensis]